MKKYLLAFILGSVFAWYISFQGYIPTLYYKVMQPEILKNHKVYYNFKIESNFLYTPQLNFESSIKNNHLNSTESKQIQKINESSLSNKNESKILTNEQESNSESNILLQKPLITLYYHYDNTGSPISDKIMFNMLSQISNSWLKCGVKLQMYPNDNNKAINKGFNITSLYAGGSSDKNDDNINNFYIVWVKSNEFSGEAFVVGTSCENCSKKDTAIYSYNIKLEKNYINLNVLKHVLIHEFGHAIGLPHSNNSTDIMYPTVNNTGEPLEPSDNDILNCKNVLSQLDLIKSQENINNGK